MRPGSRISATPSCETPPTSRCRSCIRADLHERFAAWLERVAGDRVAEYDEIVGYHLEQAHRYILELGPA